MATSTRERGGIRTRSQFSESSSWGSTSGKSGGSIASGYKGCNTTFANKVNSFKTLVSQTQGSTSNKWGRPTPTTLNTFANWINKGAIIQTVSPVQVAKWAKSKNKTFKTTTGTPTSCKNVLCAKFGKSTIKAVCRTKTGSFMVATAPKVSGKSFCFPKC